jgi:tetratricopeptide (TPR) repeat protein
VRPVFYQRRLRPNFGISWYWFSRLTIAALAIFFANFFWKFAQRTISLYRASQYQKVAYGLISENKNDEALKNVQKALFLVPDHIGSCRLMARLLDAQGDSRALEYYRFVALEGSILPSEIQLGDAPSDGGGFFDVGGDVVRNGDQFLGAKEEAVLSPNATREDAMNLALAAVKYGRLIVAWDVANLLSIKWKDLSFPHLVKASINGKMGDFGAQELELRTALSKTENLETLMAFYQFLLTQAPPKPERSSELVRIINRITQIDSSQKSLELCINTIKSSILDKNDALSLLQIIRRHPASDPSFLLFCDKFQLGLQPASRSQILQDLVKRSLALSPTERLPAVDWLLDIQEPALAHTALPLHDAFASPRTFELWVEVAIVLKQWSGIAKALADPANPLPNFRTQALEATIAGIKGNPANSRKLWSDVLAKNRDRPEVVLELLISLIRVGEWKLLYLEMPSLLNDPAWSSKTLETLIPVVRQYRDSGLILDFYGHVMKSRLISNEDIIKDRVAYTRLILGEAVPLEELELRAEKNPENSAFRITYALGMLKTGAKVKALYRLKDVEPPIRVDDLLPYQQSVYAAILAANGQVNEAQAIIKAIPPDSLTCQEEALFSLPSAAKKVN